MSTAASASCPSAPVIPTFTAYQVAINELAIYPKSPSIKIRDGDKVIEVPLYPFLGMRGEAKELTDKLKIPDVDSDNLHERLKKILRDGLTVEVSKEDVVAELGDILWYVTRIATELGVMLEEVADKNLTKLFSRKRRSTLQGSGDHR